MDETKGGRMRIINENRNKNIKNKYVNWTSQLKINE